MQRWRGGGIVLHYIRIYIYIYLYYDLMFIRVFICGECCVVVCGFHSIYYVCFLLLNGAKLFFVVGHSMSVFLHKQINTL